MNLRTALHSFSRRPFWQQLLILLGIDTLAILLAALAFRQWMMITNLYFWSSIVFFVVAAIPVVTEVGSSAKIAGRAVRGGEKVGPLLKEKQVVYDRGARTTYLFGLAGLIALVLSMLTIPLS